eukprot:4125388-Alexandrium_andersonii.AAC.1
MRSPGTCPPATSEPSAPPCRRPFDPQACTPATASPGPFTGYIRIFSDLLLVRCLPDAARGRRPVPGR